MASVPYHAHDRLATPPPPPEAEAAAPQVDPVPQRPVGPPPTGRVRPARRPGRIARARGLLPQEPRDAAR